MSVHDRIHVQEADAAAGRHGWSIEQSPNTTIYRRGRLTVVADWLPNGLIGWAGASTGGGEYNKQTNRQWELLSWLESDAS